MLLRPGMQFLSVENHARQSKLSAPPLVLDYSRTGKRKRATSEIFPQQCKFMRSGGDSERTSWPKRHERIGSRLRTQRLRVAFLAATPWIWTSCEIGLASVAMNNLVRLTAIVLLTVFTLGTVTHAANATMMSVAMSPVAMADADMGDCDGYPPGGDGKASLCVVCLAPFVAIVATGEFRLPLIAPHLPTSPLDEIDGCAGTPDPSPPRTIIL